MSLVKIIKIFVWLFGVLIKIPYFCINIYSKLYIESLIVEE